MNRFKNERKASFLKDLPEKSIEDAADDLTLRCKFNFSYFDVQAAGQAFVDWSQADLAELLEKLRDYSRQSLDYWCNQSVGKSGTVLAIYNSFPAKSDFQRPKHVPHQARWGRFRLKHAVRLVGFVLPTEYHGQAHAKTGERFDRNVFYVVFLDANHKFWKSEQN